MESMGQESGEIAEALSEEVGMGLMVVHHI